MASTKLLTTKVYSMDGSSSSYNKNDALNFVNSYKDSLENKGEGRKIQFNIRYIEGAGIIQVDVIEIVE